MTLFVVQAKGDDADALARASFVPDAFSWAAFSFGWPWLIYQRLWLALLVWALLEGAYIALVFPHVDVGVSIAVEVLARAFIGVEGNRLRQRKNARKAALTEFVEARDRDEAEVIFYGNRVFDQHKSVEAQA